MAKIRKAELSTAGGLMVACLAILLGLLLEGGRLTQVLQPTAAIIVFGGTLGAVLVQFPLPAIRRALRETRYAFRAENGISARRDQILKLALDARRAGIVSLDAQLKTIEDPFFRRGLMLAVDGIAVRELREIMEIEMDRLEEEDHRSARVWEAAGGFAPTIGILGAVLGLIQVMQRLDDIGAVGRGIAVAFVATLYGVGSANLVFLPLSGKLRLRAREAQALREMTLEGVLAIAEGATPRSLRERLGLSIPLSARTDGKLKQMAAR